jgi:D-sedoheptulose 7-phosphate isomerase
MRARYFSEFVKCLDAIQTTVRNGRSISFSDGMRRCRVSLQRAIEGHGIVHLMGNGGSAAIVKHTQNDFVKSVGVRALVHQDEPLLTACANDLGYGQSYAKPMELWLSWADLVFLVSSSGKSANILNVARLAKRRNIPLVTLSGFAPKNPLRALGDLNFYVPSMSYGYVELTHDAILHYLTDTAREDATEHISIGPRKRRHA